jgi:prepilin-type N-terminal cleavage/methylation domain-containing protein
MKRGRYIVFMLRSGPLRARFRHFPGPKGFTLIELMIVVAVIGLLTLIAIPKFSSMIRRANEAGTKGHLGHARAAIRLYYMENDQIFPEEFYVLQQSGSKYLNGNIPLYTGVHPVVSTVDTLTALDFISDAGHWAYVSGGQDGGHFWIRCTHPDSLGIPWSMY